MKKDDKEELKMDGDFLQHSAADLYEEEASDDFGSESEDGSESGEESQDSPDSAKEATASEDFEAQPEEKGEIPRDSLMEEFPK